MLLKTLQSGASGMRAHQTKLDVIGNNIANVNTPSYKKSRADFAEMVRQALGDEGIPAVNSPRPESGSGVRMVSITRMMDQGDLIHTGRELDFAIEGEGFFKVVPIDGDDDQEYYTRDSTFFINNEGLLVNAKGYQLEDIEIDTEDLKAIIVDEKGTVSRVLSDDTVEEIGTIQLYKFPAPAGLAKKGDNLYIATEASGEPEGDDPGTDGRGFIRQGYVERSNVDLATEMIGMIEAQRAYASNAKTIQTADEMWERANNMRK
ncbi:flagellar basal-body rod protein FlgG [Desulforamulus ferrireducens]|uniref:Flagellar basal-body rod protein FlgG n=1 Tax=Desulforamulus ferrireducens TaxID=1833852 RepID=A0A1S6IYE8_9FIRM|nr:flagellar basal-body rod protein FlgG [Desulforamulus ferrireducens]AQS59803.1 flagellar basal-body rod protein FlgG [Desulforamulus ferrireducens]